MSRSSEELVKRRHRVAKKGLECMSDSRIRALAIEHDLDSSSPVEDLRVDLMVVSEIQRQARIICGEDVWEE